ncbi:MAG: hypothetical protein ACKO8U_10870, partial [Pirellula sp.]
MGNTKTSSGWQRLRLAVLLVLLGSVGLFAWRFRQSSHEIARVEKLLLHEENRQAIQTLESLKGRFGDQKHIRLLLARAYRQLGNKDAFERQLELGESLGLSVETVQAENLLFLAQLGML